MGVCPENEPDLVNRDPNNINSHIKVSRFCNDIIITCDFKDTWYLRPENDSKRDFHAVSVLPFTN